MNAHWDTIPRDWRVETLAELGGQVTSGSRGWAAYYDNHGSLFVRITNLDRSNIHLDLSSSRFVQIDPNDAEARRTRLANGDLLVSITADIGIIGYIDDQVPKPAYINQHIARVRLDPRLVDSRFVAYYLASWEPQRRFVGTTDTGAKAGMNLATVAALSTVVPPLTEQSRIADALTDADDQIAMLERMIAKKQAIKQGMMQQLLNGKTRLPGFADPWVITRLGDVLTFQVGFPFRSEFFDSTPVGVRLIRNRDLRSDESQVFYRGEFDQSFVVNPGDVLVGMDGDFTPCLWRGERALLNQRVGRVRPRRCVAAFMYWALQQPLAELESGTGATTVKHLSHKDVESLVLSMPNCEEQEAIATVLADTDNEIQELHVRLAKARDIRQGMMQQLLTGRTRLLVNEGAV